MCSENKCTDQLCSYCAAQLIRTFVLAYAKQQVVSKRSSVFLGCVLYLIRVMIKPTFCICENKDADQLLGNGKADQCLCFRYIDSTIPLLSKYKISSP